LVNGVSENGSKTNFGRLQKSIRKTINDSLLAILSASSRRLFLPQ
jgi:hypothetical protein